MILPTCTSAMRTVLGFRVPYPSSQVLHHSCTVVLVVFGATTQVLVPILVVS